MSRSKFTKWILAVVGTILVVGAGVYIYKNQPLADSVKNNSSVLGASSGSPDYIMGDFLVQFKNGADSATKSVNNLGFPIASSKPLFQNISSPGSKVVKSGSELSGYYQISIATPDFGQGKSKDGKAVSSLSKAGSSAKAVSSSKIQNPDDLSAKLENQIYQWHLAILNKIQKNPNVQTASLNYIRQATWNPNDTYYQAGTDSQTGYPTTWGPKQINMSSAWDKSKGAGEVVAVVDSGVDYTHEDLAANIDKDSVGNIIGYNFTTSSSSSSTDFMDRFGHGTHAAGIIAAVGNNGKGIVGIAPSAKIMPVKVMSDTDGSGDDATIIKGINFAVDHGANVINMSLGGSNNDLILEAACNYAVSKNVVVVAAAGNDNQDALTSYPAAYQSVITVGASAEDKTLASFSNFGSKIDVVAPGKDILSTIPVGSVLAKAVPSAMVGTNYMKLSGTSMATPHVAGLAALILSNHPSWTPDQIRNSIDQKATDLGPKGIDDLYGHGLINPSSSLALLSPPVLPLLNITNLDSDISKNIQRGNFAITGSVTSNSFSSYSFQIEKQPSDRSQLNKYGPLNSTKHPDSVSNFASKSNLATGVNIVSQVDNTSRTEGPYSVRLTAKNTDGTSSSIVRQFILSKSQLPGFPIYIDTHGFGTPMTISAKLDGVNNSIIDTCATAVTVYDIAGKAQWTKDIADPNAYVSEVFSNTLSSDIDNDGKMEILNVVTNFYLDKDWASAELVVLDYQGNIKWRQPFSYDPDGTVRQKIFAISDLYGNGEKEIILGEEQWNRVGDSPSSFTNAFRVEVLDGTGKLLQDKSIAQNITGEVYGEAIAVGDINSDGKKEIAMSYSTYKDSPSYKAPSTLLTLDNNLNILWSKANQPAGTFNSLSIVSGFDNSAPSVAGILYGGGFYRAYAGIFDGKGGQAKTYSLSNYSEVGRVVPARNPSDNSLMALVSGYPGNGSTQVSLLDNSDHPVPGFTHQYVSGGSFESGNGPLALDYNGDGQLEIMLSDESNTTEILNKSGQVSSGYYQGNGWVSSSFLSDLNQGGKLDLIVRDNQYFSGAVSTLPGIYASQLPAKDTPTNLFWPMAGHDTEGTNSTVQ